MITTMNWHKEAFYKIGFCAKNRQVVEWTIERMGQRGFELRYTDELSGGERQKICIGVREMCFFVA
ncbi:MAG: hypothetical protein HFI89_08470 [Lachnospiraceae bacterium]|nr:hypothetical protein [Lachnospiraceae bacterium]